MQFFRHLRKELTRPATLQCIGAGLMFGLAFPSHPAHPLAALFGPLWAWVALSPLLLALRGVRQGASAFRRGWVSGFVGALVGLYWIGHTQGGGPAVVAGTGLGAAYLGIFTALFAVAQWQLMRRHGDRAMMAAPFLWTAMEYLQSLGEMGFPWLLLGHSQAGQPLLIQIGSTTGVYGISFVVVVVNACLSIAVADVTRRRQALGTALATLIIISGIGAWRLQQPLPDHDDIRVALVQNNLGRAKWRPGGLQASFASLDSLSRVALTSAAVDRTTAAMDQAPVDLLVWPEVAIPCDLGRQAFCRSGVRALADAYMVPILTGAPGFDPQRNEPLNTVYYIQPHTDTLLTYAKMHLVPFGERTPFLDKLPLLRDIDWVAFTGDLAPAQFARGLTRTLFPVAGTSARSTVKMSALVCFESVFPDLVRRHVAGGADVLVILTNDSWFGATSGPFQHARIAAMRAVENRRSIARCATSGISLFIDSYGRSRGHTTLDTAATRVDRLATGGSTLTFYTRHGDLFAQGCLLLTCIALLAAPRSTRHT